MRYKRQRNNLSRLLCYFDGSQYPINKGSDIRIDNVEYLLARGVDPNEFLDLWSLGVDENEVYNNFGLPLLAEVVRSGSRRLFDLFISYGADPNISDSHGITPLSMAILEKDYYMIMRLLEFEQDLNVVANFRILLFEDDEGGTPLYMAAHRGLYRLARLLLKKGADPDFPVFGKKIKDQITNKRMIRLLNSYSKEKDEQGEDEQSERDEDERSERNENEQSEDDGDDEDIPFDYEVEDIVWDPPLDSRERIMRYIYEQHIDDPREIAQLMQEDAEQMDDDYFDRWR